MKQKKDKRAQLLNIVHAWQEHFLAPPIVLCRIPGVENPCEDRCLIEASEDWLLWLVTASEGISGCLEDWNFRIKSHNPLNAKYPTAIQGWRGIRIRGAIQIILHLYRNRKGEERYCLEIDFDEWNPGRGLLPMIGHGYEWVRLRVPVILRRGPKRKTDPYYITKLMESQYGMKVRKA